VRDLLKINLPDKTLAGLGIDGEIIWWEMPDIIIMANKIINKSIRKLTKIFKRFF
jgi:hypothetical protein